MEPLSVLIPAFNAAATLERALASVDGQGAAEVVVVDDGSADATAAIAQARGARVVRHGANRGSSAALTTALGEARHDLVAFLDADDEWLPGKLTAQLRALEETPGAALVATGFAVFDVDGRHLFTWGAEPAALEGAEFWKALLAHSQIAKPTVLTRASLIARAGGFDPRLRVAEDQDMWIRLALMGPVRYLADPLVRVHEQRASLMRRHARPDLDHVLPMVERYLAQLADRLSPEEVRAIRARRYGNAARNLVAEGAWGAAWPIARRAMANGDPAWPHVANALAKLPVVRRLRGRISGG